MSRSRHTFNLIMGLWPWGKVLNRLGSLPVLRSVLQPCFGARDNEAIIIPVQEVVHGTESVVLPFPLLTALVQRASTRTILDRCLCRRGENCRAYPQGIGCLFLGDGAAQIDPALGRAASLDEALDHLRQAMDAGLVPLVVHSAFDAWLLGIPYHRALAVCFCCDCCCSVRQGLRLGPPAFWDTVLRLPGLTAVVGSECTGCGKCVNVCPVGAVFFSEGLARIGELCKGCGCCAGMCPQGAIHLQLADDAAALDWLLRRIEGRTDIGHLLGRESLACIDYQQGGPTRHRYG
jgi:UDP-glucose 4-epimerase